MRTIHLFCHVFYKDINYLLNSKEKKKMEKVIIEPKDSRNGFQSLPSGGTRTFHERWNKSRRDISGKNIRQKCPVFQITNSLPSSQE